MQTLFVSMGSVHQTMNLLLELSPIIKLLYHTSLTPSLVCSIHNDISGN